MKINNYNNNNDIYDSICDGKRDIIVLFICHQNVHDHGNINPTFI